MANRKPRKPVSPRKRETSIGNLDHTDAVWIGLEGPNGEEPSVDPESVLAEYGWYSETPLELLLLRLVDAHPSAGEAERESRLRRCMAAITGRRQQKAPNYRERSFLLEVAREFHRQHFETRQEPPLKPLIRKLLRLPKWQGLKAGSEDSSVDDLAKKFNAARDLLLVRATTAPDWDPLERSARLRQIADELAKLGVPIATGTIKGLTKEEKRQR